MGKYVSRTLLVGLFVTIVAVVWSQSRVLARLMGQSQAPVSVQAARPVRVGALGRIEPATETLEIDAQAGERLLTVFVKEGQQVKKGDEIAYLERHDVAVAEKQEIAALLEEAREQLKATDANHRTAIRLAELKLQLVETLEPIRIDGQRARVRSLEVEHKLAESEYARAERLHANGTVSKEEHDRRHTESIKMREMLSTAKLSLAEMEANYKLALESAAAELSQAKSALEVATSVIPVRSLERKLELAEARIQLSIIRAPVDGQVLKVLTHSGERVGNEPILKFGNTQEMHVVAEVYETDVPRVKIGQRAEATSAALREPIRGTVVQIGSMIFKNDVLNVDPAADADARVVEVRIRIDDPMPVTGLTNLQVHVLIDTETASAPDAAKPTGESSEPTTR
jgi:HlyD family secretion protein